jgi:hypothetical protein
MNTEVPNAPSAPVADAPTAKILATAPPAPHLNTKEAPASQPRAATTKTHPTYTATANRPVQVTGVIYEKGAAVTGPLSLLKKFGGALTKPVKVKAAAAATTAKS